MRLYHGSNIVIDSINLAMCRPYKDFGQVFYLTDIEKQAEKMAIRVARIYGEKPIVNIYEIDDDFKDLEDQLEELLEEEEQPKQQQIKETKSNQSIQKKPSPTIEVDPIAFNDSDESDFEDFHFTGIKIDEGNNSNSSSSNNNNKTKN